MFTTLIMIGLAMVAGLLLTRVYRAVQKRVLEARRLDNDAVHAVRLEPRESFEELVAVVYRDNQKLHHGKMPPGISFQPNISPFFPKVNRRGQNIKKKPAYIKPALIARRCVIAPPS